MTVQGIDEASRLADTIAANLTTIKLSDRHGLLATADVKSRLERLYQLMHSEIEILQVEKKIRSRVKKQMERTQKEYYLNEQMQAIQKELGGGERDEFKNELSEIDALLAKKQLSAEARTRGRKRSEEAQEDAPDKRRGDCRAQLHRLDVLDALGRAQRRTLRSRRGRKASSMLIISVSKNAKSASSNTWRSKRSGSVEESRPLFRRSARRG